MSNPSKILPNGPLRDRIIERVNEWTAGKCPVPSAYLDIHERAAKDDISRLMQATGCKFVAQTLYIFGEDPYMKFLRVIADHESGRLMDFRWSDGNGGGWHWHESGGFRRNEPPAEGKIYL